MYITNRRLGIFSKQMSYCQFVCLVSIYILIAFNSQFLYKTLIAISQTADVDWMFMLSIPILLFSLIVLVLSWFSLIILVKPILLLNIVICSFLFYSTFNYGVIFDKSMLQNIVETDSSEAFSYLNIQLVIFIFLTGILPSYLFHHLIFGLIF